VRSGPQARDAHKLLPLLTGNCILLKCSLLVPCNILVPFSHHSILFQIMELSSPGEEMFFAKKIVHLSFLPFLFREMRKIMGGFQNSFKPV
jgi:hypothetical protein